MQTKTINLYSFDELSDKAKERAISDQHDCNVDYEWWDTTYEDFYQFCQYFGIDVDQKKTYFTGFYHQGQGSAFTADVDVLKLVECIKGELWKEYAPKENLVFPDVTPNMERICKLIKSGKIDLQVWVETANRETGINIENEPRVDHNKINDPVRIYSAIDETANLVDIVCKKLNHWFFKNLQQDSDYRLSREAIIETIKSNEWTFTENGKLENI